MDFNEVLDRRIKLRAAFRPGRPVDKYRLFAGRSEQVGDVYDAVVTDGMHVILYGERGVGKTSLAQVLHEFLGNVGIRALSVKTINCDRTDDFTALWQKAFREMNADGQDDRELLEAILEKELIAPDDVRFLLSRLQGSRIIIFDEFDKLHDINSRILFADTIKNLADHAVSTTIMLVGVADTVDELISEHRSIERSLFQVRMPRMLSQELEEVVDRGFENAEMQIDSGAKRLIVLLSQGLPFYTHYLGLYSGLKAIEHDRLTVEVIDVADSTVKIVSKAHHIQTSYLTAVSSSQKNMYSEVLLACAMVNTDQAGFFTATDVGRPLAEITGKTYQVQEYTKHLKNFCKEDRGRVLIAVGVDYRLRYRFADALMQPYVILDGIANGTLSVDSILKARAASHSH